MFYSSDERSGALIMTKELFMNVPYLSRDRQADFLRKFDV